MSDLTGKFTGESKAGGSHFGPATNRCFGGRSVKCGIHFDGRELACVESEPVRFWQIKWVEDAAPVVKAPCARADAYFLLVEQIQMESKRYSFFVSKKMSDWEKRLRQKFDGPDKLTTLPDLDAPRYSRVFITRCYTIPFT